MNESNLRAKYGADAYDAGLKIQPQTFGQRVLEYDSLDQHFTKLWLDFAIAGMLKRPALDTRTRLLVLIGQFTMAKSYGDLEDTVRAAVTARVPAREILEIILQCIVYGGHTTAAPAIQRFHKWAAELGLLEELRASQLPPDGRDRTRSYEAERHTWHPDDIADPRFEHLMERYGWLAAGRGLTLRPRHHINILSWLDAIDPDFAGLWVRFCYQGMYGRDVVAPKTRLLCVVGNCLAIGETTQSRGHMRGAMRNGASPREVMEVILMTCVNFGMPPALHALEGFLQILSEDGRLAEIGNPPVRVESYSK
jgi:alkylhydroperoxidase/carboxymuconolactone decarboxylase family protein YurZ